MRELARRAEELELRREADARAAVSEERTRIARELHDVVGHAVTVMMVQSGAARMQVESDPAAARERLLAVEESGRAALSEMRRMLEVLRDDDDGADPLGPQPGVDDIDELVSDARAAGFEVDMAVEGEPVSLPAGEALAAYRIVQEALTNVRKHASGRRVDIRVRYLPGALELAVENEANGADPGAWDDAGGHGVIGMRERVNLYGGELDVGPRPEGGFAVRALLPIEPQPA